MAGGEAASGAAQGAAAGSMFGPVGMAAGAVIGGVGGYLSGRSKKKAAQKRMKMLQKALNQFKQGSTDAMGNTLSADKNGRWSYDLGIGGQQAANAANRANIIAGTTAPVSRTEQMRNNLAGMQKAANLSAQTNQAAALKNAARSGSNLGLISSSAAQQGSKNLRNMYQNAVQNAKNSAINNANLASSLANAQQNVAAPVQNIQGNLQGMVKGLNGTVMNQMNQMAGAAANPYLNGQDTADLLKGIGGGISGISQGQQQQMNFDKIMSVISNMSGGSDGSSGSSAGIDPSTFLSLIKMFGGGA